MNNKNMDIMPRLRKNNLQSLKVALGHLNKIKPSIEEPPKLALKQLSNHLKYQYLREKDTLVAQIPLEKLMKVLRNHKKAIGLNLADIRGINPSFFMHRIRMEEGHKPSIKLQKRLNPNIKEVMKKKIIKLLDVGIIYPIPDST